MKKVILISFSLTLTACNPLDKYESHIVVNGTQLEVNGETIAIDSKKWQLAGLGDYPFTKGGDIACSNNSVEFYPGSLHEQDIGLPLNQIAKDQFKQANFIPNVEYAIKPSAELGQAINLGLMICDLNKSKF